MKLREALQTHWKDLLQDNANDPMTGQDIYDAINGPFGNPEALDWDVADEWYGIARVNSDGYVKRDPLYRRVGQDELAPKFSESDVYALVEKLYYTYYLATGRSREEFAEHALGVKIGTRTVPREAREWVERWLVERSDRWGKLYGYVNTSEEGNNA